MFQFIRIGLQEDRRDSTRAGQRRPLRRRRNHFLLGLERLESRTVLSTINWINPLGGDWDNASNWSSNSVPGAGDDAVLSIAVTNPIIHSLSNSDEVRSLTSQDPINISGGTLAVDAASTVNNTLALSGGTLTGSGDLTVTTEFDLAGGFLSGAGKLILGPGAQMNVTGGGDSRLIDSTAAGAAVNWTGGALTGINVQGPFNLVGSAAKVLSYGTVNLSGPGTSVWGGTGTLSMGYGATFNNQAGSTIDVQSPLSILSEVPTTGTAPVFTNAGTFRQTVTTGTTTFGTIGGILNYYTPVAFTNSGTVDVQTGTLSFLGGLSNSGDVIIAGALTATSGYNQTGGSTILAGGTLGAPNVNLNGGDLSGNGTVAANLNNTAGQINPGGLGTAGVIAITGNYIQGASGALNIDIGGTGSGQFDRLTVSGTATLNGTLNVNLINGFAPAVGNSFQIMTFGSRSGDFASKNGLNLPNGLVFTPVYHPGDLTLIVVQAPATHLAFLQQPTDTVAGQAITPAVTVAVEDQFGNVVAGDTSTVTLTVASGPGTFTAGSTTAVAASNGLATFSNLVLQTAGTYTLQASDGSLVGAVSAPFTIKQATTTTTLTSSPNPSTYGQAVTFTATVSPQYAGTPTGTVQFEEGSTVLDTETLVGGTASFSTAVLTAGGHTITAVYSGDGNFTGSQNSETQTVNQRPITVTADAKSKTYGDADPALTYQITSGTLVNGDSFNGALTRAAGENVGTYAIQQGTLALSSNYTLGYVGANLMITPATLIVTACNLDINHGDAIPTPRYQVSGFVGHDTQSVLTGAPAFSTPPNANGAAGVYPITVTQGSLAATNYVF